MVAPVADVDPNLTERRLEHGVPSVAFHVVGAFIEVAHARNMILSVFADDVPVVANHHCRVPNGRAVLLIALQDGADDDHAPLACHLLTKHGRRARLRGLGELAPLLFPSAESKRHWPSLLQASNLDTGLACRVEERADALIDAFPLLCEGRGRGVRHLVLDDAHLHDAWFAQLLCRGPKLVRLQIKVARFRILGQGARKLQALHRLALVPPVHYAPHLRQLGLGQVLLENGVDATEPTQGSIG
mmetsp:Transcript_26567/g.44478  ORF Transcript_26567/g.44478 Transcript_26567/m.44478 type:complete len:244 (+) Transcript_26567:547-1278(+)